MSGTVTFDVTSGDSKVKVWKAHPDYPAVNKLKYSEISLPVTYNTPADLPKTFYVEGVEPSEIPCDVVFTHSYTKGGLTFKDRVNVTVVHVELFRDAGYTELLDDWPKSGDLLRSPKYIFGEDDPIYVQVKNIGTDPNVAESKDAAVAVISQSSDYIYLDLKETGVDTQIFRNSEAERGELLYLSTEDNDDYPTTTDPDKITVMNEEVMYFYLRIPPGGTAYKRSVDVMVDRAEIGVEYQEKYVLYYSCNPKWPNIASDRFGQQLFDNIGGEPNLVWFKNFCNPDIYSLPCHWHENTDTCFADSVDMTSWSGHRGSSWRSMHIFKKDHSCDKFLLMNTNLGNTDADWIIFDTCNSLATDHIMDYNDLEDELVSSVSGQRCAHLFLGFYSLGYWDKLDCGEHFADLLEDGSIKQAWFDYCKDRQPSGTVVRIFGAEDCMGDSVAGTGPIEVSRDPTKDSVWKGDFYQKPP